MDTQEKLFNASMKWVKDNYHGSIESISITAVDLYMAGEKVVVNGRNIFDENYITFRPNYYITADGEELRSTNYKHSVEYIPVKPNTAYSVQYNKTSTKNAAFTVPLYSENKEFITRIVASGATSSTGNKIGHFRTTADTRYILFSCPQTIENLQIEEGTVVHTYEPFNGEHIKKIRVGDRVNLRFPFGRGTNPPIVTRLLTCLEIDYNLYNPENTNFRFGIPSMALTKNRRSSGTSTNKRSSSPGYKPPTEDPTETDDYDKWFNQVRKWLRQNKVWYNHNVPAKKQGGPTLVDSAGQTHPPYFWVFDPQMGTDGRGKIRFWSPVITGIDAHGNITWGVDSQGRSRGSWLLREYSELNDTLLKNHHIYDYVIYEYGIDLRTGLAVKMPAVTTDENGNLSFFSGIFSGEGGGGLLDSPVVKKVAEFLGVDQVLNVFNSDGLNVAKILGDDGTYLFAELDDQGNVKTDEHGDPVYINIRDIHHTTQDLKDDLEATGHKVDLLDGDVTLIGQTLGDNTYGLIKTVADQGNTIASISDDVVLIGQDLDQSVADLTSDLATLGQTVTNISSDVTIIGQKVGDNTSGLIKDLADTKATVTSINTDVINLGGDMTQAQADIARNGQSIVTINSDILSLSSEVHAEIANTESTLINYIHQSASGTWQRVVNYTNKTWIQDTDPTTGSDPVTAKEGDVWVESTLQGTWDGAEGFDWDHDSGYDWTQIQGAKIWVRKNNAWQLASDEQQVVTYSDVVNTAEHYVNLKIAGIVNDEGLLDIYMSKIEQTATNIRLEVNAADSILYSFINQSASQIRLEVGDSLSGVYSSITQTADSIRSDVTAANSAIYSSIEQTASQIKSEVGDSLSGVYSSITQTANSIRSDVTASNSAIYSAIEQTASQIKSEVGDSLSGVYSSITQTANSIRSDVTEANSAIYSAIEQTASQIKSEVGDSLSGVYSSITQTANSIRSDVTAANSAIYSAIEQTASQIKSEVGDSLSGVYSSITQTANSIRSDITEANSAIYSAIEQTASQIKSEVGDSLSGVYSSITQTANSIRSDVSRANSDIYSAIEQTEQAIYSEVGDSLSGVYSSITQTANSIRSDITESNSAIYSAIEQTASQIYSELANTESGLYNYVLQTASGTRQYIVSTTNRTWVQDTDPTTPAGGNNTAKEGDIWIESTSQGTWDGAEGFDWDHDSGYDWTQIQGAKVWAWKNNKWELATDQQQLVTYTDVINTAEHYSRMMFEEFVNDGVVDELGSRIDQTARDIRLEVFAANSQIYTEIHQTASYIRSTVANELEDIQSTIEQESGEINLRVSNKPSVARGKTAPTSIDDRGLKENDIWIESENLDSWDALYDADISWSDESTIEWNKLRSDSVWVYRDGKWVQSLDGVNLVNDADIKLTDNTIRMFARKLEQINGEKEAYYAELKIDSNRIRSEVSEKYSGLSSSITQTAAQIRSEVRNNITGVYSSITQTADQIRSEVSDNISGLQSSITQQANKIALVVEGTGANAHIKAAQIVASINAQDGQSAIFLDANKIKIGSDSGTTVDLGDAIGIQDGYVSIKKGALFNQSAIFGNGKIIAIQGDAGGGTIGTISLSYANMKNAIKSASVSSDGKTLTLTPFTGSAINFSKPSSSPPSITNSGTGVWTSSGIPSGAKSLSHLVTEFRRAEDDGDNLIIKVNNPGGSPILYYCTP